MDSMKHDIDAWTSCKDFYDKLHELREIYQRSNPKQDPGDINLSESMVEPKVTFSGEERVGRYLDLHEFYNRYINLNKSPQKIINLNKSRKPLEYIAYLDVFLAVESIPLKVRATKQYRDYVFDLVQYLISFLERSRPLMDVHRVLSEVEAEFEKQWMAKRKRGRLSETVTTSVDDIDRYSTVEELMELGSAELKQALAAMGLKSGGTLQQRAERLLLAKNTPLEKLDPKHFTKEGGDLNCKETTLMEAKLKKLGNILKDTADRTRERLQNRQAMRYRELVFDDCIDSDEYDDEDEEKQQKSKDNPLKLSVPYWLYKLQGLDKEFKCQICGDYSYWGRRAFEKHFNERRHQHGMRCLGILNTKSFYEIMEIADAKKLWEEIQLRQGLSKWSPEQDEECEDDQGNIYNKKTYTDLQRQGLI